MPTGKITDAGRTHIGQRLEQNLAGSTTTPALTDSFGYIEIGTGVKGTLAASANIAINGNLSAGTTSIPLKDSAASSLTGTLIAGDTIQIAGDPTVYTVTTGGTAAANALSVTITPGLLQAAADGAVVTTDMGGLPGNVTASVRTPLASGGRRVLDATYPKIEYPGTGPEIVLQATFPAGSFTTGTPITEAAWVNSAGNRCGARIAFATSRNPSASEPLTVTMRLQVLPPPQAS